jgi:predicted flap endonuclease-1-like 5' DNA nuclease
VIVLSLFLVIVAAVTLIAGFFADGLELIYTSIGACVLALLFLGGGVLMRRRSQPAEGPTTGYGPGAAPARPAPAASAPVRPVGVTRSTGLLDDEDDAVIVRSDAPAKKAVAKKAVAKKAVARKATTTAAAADDTAEIEVVRTGSRKAAPARKSAAKKSAAKKSAAKAAPAKKSAAKKSAAKKSAAKKSAAKKSAAKKSAAKKKTTGAAARAVLADIKGVGPAKQDALLKAFWSLEDMRAASVEDLTAVSGIGEALAGAIKKAL